MCTKSANALRSDDNSFFVGNLFDKFSRFHNGFHERVHGKTVKEKKEKLSEYEIIRQDFSKAEWMI